MYPLLVSDRYKEHLLYIERDVPDAILSSILIHVFYYHTFQVNTTELITSLHPRSQDHSSDDTRRATASEKLPPSIFERSLTVKNVLNDVELSPHGSGLWSGAVALQSGEDFKSFIVSALTDQQTW